jgi:inorganic triphosphatase YgiF
VSEIELKLSASPRDFAKFTAALPRLATVVQGLQTKHVVTQYFETPDLALVRRGISLRLRDSDGHHSQGLKARRQPNDGTRPMLASERGEWEWPVESGKLDFRPLNSEEAAALLPVHAVATLSSIFATDIRRTEVELEAGDGAHVKLALDQGRVVAGPREQPVCEIELELANDGPIAQQGTLYRLGLELHRIAPVAISMVSKAERGYRLVTHQPPSSSKAPPLTLANDISARDGIRMIFRASLGHLLDNQAAALASDASGIHQMRVAIRRLRSALKLFRPVIASPETVWVEGELKWLGTELGRARDWDVLATSTLDRVAKGAAVSDAIKALHPAVAVQRRAAHKAASRAITGPRYTTFVLAFGLWIEEGHWHEGLDARHRRQLPKRFIKLANDILDRAAEKAAKRGRHIARANSRERHQLRKALKGLRYATDFLGTLYPVKRTKHFKQMLGDLQDCLGLLNDNAAAAHLLDTLVRADKRRSTSARRIKAALHHHEMECVEGLPAIYRRYEKLKPFWD